jgi:hypothetical protein
MSPRGRVNRWVLKKHHLKNFMNKVRILWSSGKSVISRKISRIFGLVHAQWKMHTAQPVLQIRCHRVCLAVTPLFSFFFLACLASTQTWYVA